MKISINSKDLSYETFRNVPLMLISGTAETSPIAREVGEQIRLAQSHRRFVCRDEDGEPLIGSGGQALTETRQVHHLWKCPTLAEYARGSRSQALGRWWFESNLDSLSGADRKSLDALIKKPSRYGTVLLYSEDYTKRRDVSSVLAKSKDLHELNVSYPGKRFLAARFSRLSDNRGLDISQGVAEYCVDRLGVRYADYARYIEAAIPHLNSSKDGRRQEITKEAARETLRGVDGLTIDDFMERLVKPLTKDTLSPNTKLFKAYRAALDSYGAKRLLGMVNYRVKQYMVLRSLIDEGILPVGIDYAAESVHKTIGEPPEKRPKEFTRYSILNWGDYKLRKEAELAGSTTLADWVWLKMCLSKPCNSDEAAETLLFAVMARSQLAASALNDLVSKK